jgi:hypothetical protein
VFSRSFIAGLIFVLASAGAPAFAVDPGVKGRIAGDGPDAAYYLAKTVDAGVVICHLHTLEFYKTQGEPTANLGYHLADVDAALEKAHTALAALIKKGQIVQVIYNLPVTTTEKEQAVSFIMFPDTKIAFGKGYATELTRVRVDDGQLKGREFFARRIVPRTHVVQSDRAWLRVEGMKAIALSENPKEVRKFWAAVAKHDQTASAQAYIDGNFAQVPPDTQCDVMQLSADHNFAFVRVQKDGAPHLYWVLASAASLEPPAK